MNQFQEEDRLLIIVIYLLMPFIFESFPLFKQQIYISIFIGKLGIFVKKEVDFLISLFFIHNYPPKFVIIYFLLIALILYK